MKTLSEATRRDGFAGAASVWLFFNEPFQPFPSRMDFEQ